MSERPLRVVLADDAVLLREAIAASLAAGGFEVVGQADGIDGLVDRIGAVGGTLTIDSPPGGGTVLHARIPAHAR